MHLLWRRPDGFHGASPTDFKVLELDGQSRLWLHKTDNEWFPFRISGGWQDEEQTKRLNNLIALINCPTGDWISYLIKLHHNSMADDGAKFIADLETWLTELRANAKGDKWEVEIIGQALDEVKKHLDNAGPAFLQAVGQ